MLTTKKSGAWLYAVRSLGCVVTFGVPSVALVAQDPEQPSSGHYVDLSDESVSLAELDDSSPAERMGRAWYQNITVSGFAAVGFLDTGNVGVRPKGGFQVKEATLWVDAEVWEDTNVFLEVQTNRLGKDDQLFVRTGEVYARFRNVLADELGEGKLGVKISAHQGKIWAENHPDGGSTFHLELPVDVGIGAC